MYEYKVVTAPLRAVKVKGLKTTEERFAHMLQEALNDEAREGWEYLRAETLPCEERKGLTGTAKSFQSVLVFRRPWALADARAEEAHNEADAPVVALAAHQPHARQEPQFRSGAAQFADHAPAQPVLSAGNHKPPTDQPTEADNSDAPTRD